MITFLPSSDMAESVSMLDSKRLGNQRVEARMILRWLRNPQEYSRHQNAGYTRMWHGYENALAQYYNLCCEEWGRRGGKNIVCQPEEVPSDIEMPPWLGDDRLHRTHRSALLYKFPEHYSRFGWANEITDPKVDYLWPSFGNDAEYDLLPPGYWKENKKIARSKARKRKSGSSEISEIDEPGANSQKKRARATSGTGRQSESRKKKSASSGSGATQSRYSQRRPRRSARLSNK
ncbi:hypothetical protein THAOC_17433 [Thalassiosira oceanica]|uniref:Uncharacterized protein n=1 Tax=Thalassiosira oceanica TaxID=159749 RepID=K0SAJ3_THAOC|nr:hypothetical protein THAOC_17433 [Thalassiosira oceanica]|mmetsp:Transcript_38588/g.92331  ORF Transcript_38588/g.92331 Transcript_38588/m.92331 type:complete len:233 (-) Transcript_38588:26-724(-)|eukprot:EJK61984.1 hypothetical protein THAOC_17433 [Thalassiosira oceanica]